MKDFVSVTTTETFYSSFSFYLFKKIEICDLFSNLFETFTMIL